MYLESTILDLIIAKCTFEYSGIHNSDPKSPLWGRRAYWRVFVPGYGFACKVTAPVKSIKPKQATLDKLLRAELKKRFEAIHERVEFNHYREMMVVYRDPYSVRPLLKCVEGKYHDLEVRALANGGAQ